MSGYALNSKGYNSWDAKLKKFVISLNVNFDESISVSEFVFPLEKESSKPNSELESTVDKSDAV